MSNLTYTRRPKAIVIRGIATPMAIFIGWTREGGFSKFEVSPGGGGKAGVGLAISLFFDAV
jgi:hypothetical protein